MPRYILLSFLVMGWGFYELSGGADFQPPVVSPSQTASTDTRSDTPSRLAKSQIARASQTRARLPEPAPDAARPNAPKVVLASLQAEDRTNKTNRAAPAAQAGEPIADQPSETRVFSLQDMVAPPPIANAANPTGTPVRAAPVRQADMREIVATRVNMRAGPDLQSDILTRLARGDSVEVLEDSGDGWLRLRALPQDRVGWIAARLVSPAETGRD